MRLFLLYILISFTSCRYIFIKYAGIKKIKHVKEDTILKTVKKYYRNPSIICEMRKEYITYIFNTFDTANVNDKYWINNLLQPLQVLYFDTIGNLCSSLVNCNIDAGIRENGWIKKQYLGTFPIVNNNKTHKIRLSTYLDNFKVLENKKEYSKNNFTVVFVWSYSMGLQNKHFLNAATLALNRVQCAEINIYFCCIDNIYKQGSGL